MITEEKKSIFRLPIQSYLDKMTSGKDEASKKEMKDTFMKRVNRVITLSPKYHFDRVPTLDDALLLLGRAHIRLILLNGTAEFIQKVLCRSSKQWPEELWNLQELTNKEIKTCERLVKTLIYRQEKSNANPPNKF